MFADSQLGMLLGLIFTLLLASACVSDLRTRRIPNALVLTTALIGIGYSVAIAPYVEGGLGALSGIGIGLVIWLPLYVLRLLGAGDVKFFAAASAWLGPAIALEAALLSAICGGVLALVQLWRRDSWLLTLTNLSLAIKQPRALAELPRVANAPRRLPYGVAMAAGLSIAAWFPGCLLG
jgi:prepilin peptidase CpaA